jgi:hypothetical protein
MNRMMLGSFLNIAPSYTETKPSRASASTISGNEDDVADKDFLKYGSLQGQGQPHGTIRLLSLHPDIKGDPIACSLFMTHQYKATKYAALSYMWGNNKHDYFIQVNGRSLAIGPNPWGS